MNQFNKAFLTSKKAKNNLAWSPRAYWLLMPLLIGVLSLPACGFHLKGLGAADSVVFKSIYLAETGGVRRDILRALKRKLVSSGVVLSANAMDAELFLEMRPTAYHATNTSLAVTGEATAQLLKMQQAFRVIDVKTEKDVVSATAVSFQNRSIDTSASLAANRELASMQLRMASEVAQKMIDRINRAYRLQSSAAP